jgi:NitT/TauT family transport system permease protein
MSELSALAEPVPPAGKVSAAPLRSAVARRRVRQLQVQVLRVALAVGVVGGWELGARAGVIDPFFWGKPSGIANQIWVWITEGTAQGPLWEQIAATMEETVLGFIIGVILGVTLGILLGRNRFLADIMSPYIKAANAIPRVVLGSIFVLAFGLGMQSKVALAVVLVFFVVFFNAFQGVREVDKNLLANARILGADDRRVTTEVIIPSALSWIMASLHVSFGFALVGAVVGEYLGAIKGVGLMIVVAQNTFNANGVFAAIVILATVALVAEALVTAIENRLVKWRPNAVTEVTI